VIRPDGSKATGRVSLDTFAEVHPGASQAEPRLRFMDRHGLSLQILYPNILGFAGNFVMRIEDAALRNLCVTAYNDGAAALQSESGGRLLPQALLPFWDVALSARELARCHEELGLTGLVISDSPELWGLPTLSEPYWDPLWAEAQERGLPVNFHIGGGSFSGAPWAGMSQARNIATMSSLAFIGNVRCVANLIFSGLLDRFPRLKFVSVESGMGWLPFLLELCEYQVDENGVTDLALRPREYFRRQIYASYWFEKDAATAVAKLGEDNLMFETDFPHPTCLYPDIQAQVEQTLGGLPARVQRKILYETAARVYQLSLPGRAGTRSGA
jgi:predicted TIM-barrel fold metal-dependent hydrolase